MHEPAGSRGRTWKQGCVSELALGPTLWQLRLAGAGSVRSLSPSSDTQEPRGTVFGGEERLCPGWAIQHPLEQMPSIHDWAGHYPYAVAELMAGSSPAQRMCQSPSSLMHLFLAP